MLDHPLIVVSGKGGVGKSAIASGLALVAQRRGLRVLAIDMTGSSGLESHLGLTDLAFEPREVKPGLHVMRMDRSRALLEYLSIQLRIPGISRFGAVARAFDALATTAPGIREIITIGKAIWEVREQRWDVVIADAPPTGQISSYLRAPKTVSELVPSGRIRVQAQAMAETLLDPSQTRIVLAATPEELPVTETTETVDAIAEEGLVAPPTIVMNRVLPKPPGGKLPTGVVGEAARVHQALWDEQQPWLARFPDSMTIPFLFGVFTPAEVAARISDVLEAQT